LKVDPTELQVTAAQLEGHASVFGTAHQTAQSRAGKAALGSGLAATALPAMLEAWESDGARFGTHFAKHAQGHRDAAADRPRHVNHATGARAAFAPNLDALQPLRETPDRVVDRKQFVRLVEVAEVRMRERGFA